MNKWENRRMRIAFLSLFVLSGAALHAQNEYKAMNLGPAINTPYCELRPLISPDGKTLYFIRESDPENTMINEYYDCQDIWYATLQEDGSWSKARHLGYPFNQKRYNAVFSITPDGNSMLVRTTWDKDLISIKGFGIARKTSNGWTPPQWQFIQDYEKINMGMYNGAFLSIDGRILLIYMSEQKGGEINDLYVCFLQENKRWSKPKKLPSPVNTSYDEIAPFLAADGKTLYFSSNRPGGLGSNDIYVTTRLDDSWEKWSEPRNLGPSVNTDDWDAYYSIDAAGEYAYLVSYKNSFGEGDIIRIRLKEEFRPEPVVLIAGKTINARTGKAIAADISYEILPEGLQAGTATSDPVNGEYKIILPYGKLYGFTASAQGFFPVSENIDLRTTQSYQEIQRNLLLVPVEKGETIRLNNIFFDFNQATLREESYPELNRVVSFLSGNPSVMIEVAGHTDDTGSDEFNMKLSAERAKAVATYLISKGIAPSRITVKGYGKTKPIASNATEEGKQQNRRVEFMILKK